MNREEDNERSSMIVSMERTLNSSWFGRRASARSQCCTLSTSQYWDWLTYIDVSTINDTPTFYLTLILFHVLG